MNQTGQSCRQSREENGAGAGIRTPDLLITSEKQGGGGGSARHKIQQFSSYTNAPECASFGATGQSYRQSRLVQPFQIFEQFASWHQYTTKKGARRINEGVNKALIDAPKPKQLATNGWSKLPSLTPLGRKEGGVVNLDCGDEQPSASMTDFRASGFGFGHFWNPCSLYPVGCINGSTRKRTET